MRRFLVWGRARALRPVPARRAVFSALLVALAPLAAAQEDPEEGQRSSVPVTLTDGRGFAWDVQGDGTIKDGTSDAYDDGLRLTVNGQNFPGVDAALLSADGREIVLGPRAIGDLEVTRRIWISPTDGFARYLDVVHNPGAETVPVSLSVSIDVGSDSSTRIVATSSGDRVVDPEDFGLVTDDGGGGANDAVVVTIYADRMASSRPTVSAADGTDRMTLSMTGVFLPPRSRGAFLFIAAQRSSTDEALRFLSAFDPNPVLEAIPDDLRSAVWNFGPGLHMVAPLVLPREEGREAIELITGDRLRGEVKPTVYRLETAFGRIEASTEDLAGLEFGQPGKTLDRMVFESGSVYSGQLSPRVVTIAVPSTGTFEVPAARVARLLLRVRAASTPPDPGAAAPHLAILLTGDRFQGEVLSPTFSLRTRYGVLEFQVGEVVAIHLTTGRPSLHQLTLSDGSTSTGLLDSGPIRMKLDVGLETSIPAPLLEALVRPLGQKPEGLAGRPVVRLSDGDVFVGRPAPGTWRLETVFGEVQVPTERISSAEFSRGQWRVVRLVMWDEGELSGRVLDETLSFQLSSGKTLSFDPGHIQVVEIPFPEIPEEAKAEVLRWMAELGDPDWNRRQEAKRQLVRIGKPAIPMLRERLAAEEDPEVQAALESILEEIEGK
ncbi:MAG: HEAT repeat domain-containing protein [Planctomycetes bacterium]|nr:HEAT repeat domain-containing protein [Planctomycetota bacterium]